MTVEQPNIVDFIGVDPATNEVVLTISDHLTWNGEDEHLLLLQEKLNRYLAFVESGEIRVTYPNSKDRAVRINVVCAYPFDGTAKAFFDRASQIVENAGFRLTYHLFAD